MYRDWQISKAEMQAEDDTARNQYAEVAQWCNDSGKYKITEDGDFYKVVPIPAPTEQELADREIAELKQYLADTDYIANKLIEAIDDSELNDLKEKYADVLRQRREARARINELEK